METAAIVGTLDLCYCTTLRKAARRISQFYEEKLQPTGLRVTQFAMLRVIGESREIAINELATRLELDRTTTGKNLRPLERAGLIAVKPSSTDGRSRTVALTPEGDAILIVATPLWNEAQQEFERNLGGDAAALRDRLGALGIE
ncbi:MAG TPA: MarR family transcriptional regulator [Thermomicrobiales bacterium]|nr:MarR family transcriptional regulator [Thermomicrobiales bacterium]